MKLSFTGAPDFMDRNVGFGNAAWHIRESLENLGVDVIVKDNLASPQGIDILPPGFGLNLGDFDIINTNAPIGLSFAPPDIFSFENNQYKIGYVPWESTELRNNWQFYLAGLDELWVPSKWNKKIFEQHFDKEIFVYPHGLDHKYTPKKRKYDASTPFTFFHHGEPSARKAGQLVLETFVRLFGNDSRYQLIMKASKYHTLELPSPDGTLVGPPDVLYKNVHIITDYLKENELIYLYNQADCFVYPSWGEGFGFAPLQAMGMGIPTICTSGWAEYANYITLPLESSWQMTPWQHIHPGFALCPDSAQLEMHMLDVIQNYDKYAEIAFKNSFKLHKEFDWEEVTKPAVERLQKISKTLGL